VFVLQGFVKVIKNKAYFKRFQVKFRRRRECKTDYYARQRLITQDKNKYKTPKYRLVVRFTNRDVIVQIFSSDLTHDVCLAAAYSHELAALGLKSTNTNYATAYATGLLLARRVNKKLGLSYEGNSKVDGEDFNVEANEEGPKPFKAILDVGLRRTTTGSRLFGALKGACDGGIDVPHNDHRFPGSKRDGKKDWATDPKKHREYIFGLHVASYMKNLKANNEEEYKRKFSSYIKAGVTAENIEKMYKDLHANIRKNPESKRDEKAVGYFSDKKRAAAKKAADKKKSVKVAVPFLTKKEKAIQKKRENATKKAPKKVRPEHKGTTAKRSNAQRHNRVAQMLGNLYKGEKPIDDILKPKARD